MYLTHATPRITARRSVAIVAVVLAAILGAGLLAAPARATTTVPQIEVLGVAAAPLKAPAKTAKPAKAEKPAKVKAAKPAKAKAARVLTKSARALLTKIRTLGPALSTVQRYDDAFLALTNAARTEAGLKPLTLRKGLGKLAGYWTGEMTSGHTGYSLQHNPDLTAAVTAIYPKARAWGENVASFAVEYHSAKLIFDSYMASPGHRANIMNPVYRYIGIATACAPGSSVTCFNTTNFSR